MEGHYIRGYGDSQKPDAEIELLPGAVEEADQFLADQEASKERLVKVSELIEGFETPYGMELLATVHWVANFGGRHGEAVTNTSEEAMHLVHAWNPRKQRVFKPDHIRTAWVRLDQMGWMPTTSH